MYTSTENTNYILEAVEDNNLPKHLFYTKKINSNPVKTIDFNSEILGNNGQATSNISNIVYCFETNKEIAKDGKLELDIQKYNYKEFRTIKEIFYKIIITIGILILAIISYILSFQNNKYYHEYRDYFIKIDKTYNKLINDNANDLFKELTPKSIIPSYTKFWCKVGIFEKYVLISLIIFSILYLLFLIFSVLIHKNRIFKLNYNNGGSILYKNLIVINSTFFIINYIYGFLFACLFIYTLVVSILNPDKNILSDKSWSEKYPEINNLENNWKNNKVKHYFNIPIQILITILVYLLAKNNIYLILDYLNMNYQENDEEEDIYKNKKNIE